MYYWAAVQFTSVFCSKLDDSAVDVNNTGVDAWREVSNKEATQVHHYIITSWYA
jgi:hypothetical protein